MERSPSIRNIALLAATLGSLGISYNLYEKGTEDLFRQSAPIVGNRWPILCSPPLLDTHQGYSSGNETVANPDPCDTSGSDTVAGDALNSNSSAG